MFNFFFFALYSIYININNFNFSFIFYQSLLCNAQNKSFYNIHPLDLKTGLYIEELGVVKTFYTDWRLVTYVNLSVYEEEFQYLKDAVQKAHDVCNWWYRNITDECQVALNQTDKVLAEINEYDTKWFIKKTNNTLNRKKRGLINIIGSLQKSLFGTLAEEDAQLYLKEFRNLRRHDRKQNDIIKRQTTLINSAINTMNITLRRANNIIGTFAKPEKDLSNLSTRTHTNAIFNYILLLIVQFQSKQKLLIDAIGLSQGSANHPGLIPPAVFYNELQKIRTKITAQNLDLPLTLNENAISMFYHISTAEARIMEDQLIISFTLPLVNTKEYNLYKATSLPYKVRDNLYSYIVPQHEYVAMDVLKENYLPISNSELDDCIQISEKSIICKLTFPEMYTRSSKSCEIIILRNEKITDECNIRITNLTSEMWIHLKQPNTYVYVFPKKSNVYVQCNNSTVLPSNELEGTGIIQIEPGCKIKTDYMIITAFETITTVIYRELSPSFKTNFNISKYLYEIPSLESLHIPHISYPNVIENGEYQELEDISFGIDEIIQLENQLEHGLSPEDFKSDIHYLFWSVVIITIGVLIIKFRFCYTKVSKRTRKYRAVRAKRSEPPIEIIIQNETNTNPEPQQDSDESFDEPILFAPLSRNASTTTVYDVPPTPRPILKIRPDVPNSPRPSLKHDFEIQPKRKNAKIKYIDLAAPTTSQRITEENTYEIPEPMQPIKVQIQKPLRKEALYVNMQMPKMATYNFTDPPNQETQN